MEGMQVQFYSIKSTSLYTDATTAQPINKKSMKPTVSLDTEIPSRHMNPVNDNISLLKERPTNPFDLWVMPPQPQAYIKCRRHDFF
jgi:hypothetical protein